MVTTPLKSTSPSGTCKEHVRRSEHIRKSDSSKGEALSWTVPKHYCLPRKVVSRSMETLDSKDSPEKPGLMLEDTLKEAVSRFDNVFSPEPTRTKFRQEQIEPIIQHLQRHTRRRRGENVLNDGFLEWENTSKVYELFTVDLNIFERIFFTIDVSESTSILSKLCSTFLVTMILLSIAVWMISTLPAFTIEDPDCIGTKVGDCEPSELKEFRVLEEICVYVFTVEYLVRLFTVHSVRFQLLDEPFIEGLLTGSWASNGKETITSHAITTSMRYTTTATLLGRFNHATQKLDGKLMTTVKHVLNIANIIDLLAILPFWIEKVSGSKDTGSGALMVLRILRLTRIFRVFKLGKYNDVFLLFSRVINQSMPALSLMLFFISLGCCLFGTLIWFFEGGEWYPKDHPELIRLEIAGRGAYLRPESAAKGALLEETPFLSIVHSFWYVIVTITTVGYGDAYPTSWEGKIVGSFTILNGIIVLAMPIGVVGANFSSEYYRVMDEKRKRQRLKLELDTLAAVEEEQDAALEENPTAEGKDMENIAVELHRTDVSRRNILLEAEKLDQRWKDHLPTLLYQEVSRDLRHFLNAFLLHDGSQGSVAKPIVSPSQFVQLDALTTKVHSALTAITVVEDLPEFGLKEAKEYRKMWADFTDSCWTYVVEVCQVERPVDPPEFFEMKAKLVRAKAPGVDSSAVQSVQIPIRHGGASDDVGNKDVSKQGGVTDANSASHHRLPGMPEDAGVTENGGLRGGAADKATSRHASPAISG